MFNPFQMMQSQVQSMQEKMMNQMQQQNPQAFQKVQEMMQGKNEQQMKELVNNVAKQQGIDINQFAKHFGITL